MANFYAQYPPQGVAGSNASVGPTGTTAPTSATEIGGIDSGSGNLVAVSVDSAGRINTNINGTVPISGTVTANQGTPGVGAWPTLAAQSGTWNITNISGTVSLPTGASTSALQTSGNTQLVTIASNQTNGTQVTAVNNFPATQPVSGTVAATQSGTWNITNISGTVSLPTGAATSANQTTEIASLATIATNTALAPHTATSAVTSVASSATNVTILASNATRKQAAVYNESTQILYLKLGTTASVTSYTVQIPASGYYELPGITVYTGQIDGIWASANGNARVTELS